MQARWRKARPHFGLGAAALSLALVSGPALAQPETFALPPSVEVSSGWSARDVAELRHALRGASAHGLDASALAADLEGADPADSARLSRIALTYARALAFGVTDPRKLHETFDLLTNQRALEPELAMALQQGRLGGWLGSLAPQDADYRALSAAYREARAEADAHPDAKPAHDQARALAISLERLRWLDRRPDATRIDVNIAATRLWFFKDGQLLDSRKVVAGKPGHETPLLQASFRRIVVNPAWNVPAKIAKTEILVKGPGYMERHNMRLVDGRVVQEPGPDNSLGQVKFDLQDDQAIYLHDTPAQSAFERADRHLSHGCIRVEDAVGFARLVSEQFGAAEKFDDRLAAGETGSVVLPAEVPVRLLYLTAYVDDGQVRFVKDRYGWDAKLADALGLGDDRLSAPLR